MQELKQQVLDKMNRLNQAWIQTIREGEEKGGIDLNEMFGVYSAIMLDLEQQFSTFQDRISVGKKKKGWLK